MGLFLQTCGVPDATTDEVVAHLLPFCESMDMQMHVTTETDHPEQDYDLARSEAGHVCVRLPADACEYESLSKHLSVVMARPVVGAAIYNGEFWFYDLFKNGKSIASFTTLPYYFESDPAKVTMREDGHAELLAEHWPGIEAGDVRAYFRFWNDKLTGNASPDDAYDYGNEWQFVDLYRRLGLVYPNPGMSPAPTTIGPVNPVRRRARKLSLNERIKRFLGFRR